MSPTETGGPSPAEMGVNTPSAETVVPTETAALVEGETRKLVRLTREEVDARLREGQNLENFNLSGLDLAGLSLDGVSFRGSDIRGLKLFRREGDDDETAKRTFTKVNGADFTDAVFADFEEQTFFVGAEAEGTVFGYSEDLVTRRARHAAKRKATGVVAGVEDSGALFGFYGNGGKFKKTKWTNIDFGGQDPEKESYLEPASLDGADLTEATIEGCDLSHIDLSTTTIDGLQIINPVHLESMIITEDQVETVAAAISFTDDRQNAWSEEKKQYGSRELLEKKFKIIIQ